MGLGILCLTLSGHSQEVPDSIWVDLFNGSDFDGLYTFTGGQIDETPGVPSGPFDVEDGLIHVSPGGNHIATLKKYSYYRMRVDYKFGESCTWTPDGGGQRCNAGIMWHVDEEKPKCFGGAFPTSVECQMYQGDAANLISICGVTVTMNRTNGQWDPEGTPFIQTVDVNGSEYNYNSRFLVGPEDNQHLENYGDWNTLEVIMLGDSMVTHLLNGNVAVVATDIRYTGPDDPDNSIPWGEGTIALQAEGAEIWYRNWQIAELKGCTNPEAENYQEWAVVEKDSSDCVFPVKADSPSGNDSAQPEFMITGGTLHFNSSERYQLAIKDVRGKVRYSGSVQGEKIIRLPMLESGLYLLESERKGRKKVFKFVY